MLHNGKIGFTMSLVGIVDGFKAHIQEYYKHLYQKHSNTKADFYHILQKKKVRTSQRKSQDAIEGSRRFS